VGDELARLLAAPDLAAVFVLSDGLGVNGSRLVRGLTASLPASVVVGYFIGHLLDRWLGTHFLYIVFLLLGIAAGFVQLIRQVQKSSGD